MTEPREKPLTPVEQAAEDLAFLLSIYRGIREGACWLRERLADQPYRPGLVTHRPAKPKTQDRLW